MIIIQSWIYITCSKCSTNPAENDPRCYHPYQNTLAPLPPHFCSFGFSLYNSTHSHPHSASGPGGVGQPAGGSQVWDESGHQPQAQHDLNTGGVQQHQPSGAAVGVGQSQPTAHLTARHEGKEEDVELLDSIIHKHVGTRALTQLKKMDIHSPHRIHATDHARVNIGQAFLLQYTA